MAPAASMSGLQMARHIVRCEGVLGLYRGFGASIVTFVPSSALWWGGYGFYQRSIWKEVWTRAACVGTKQRRLGLRYVLWCTFMQEFGLACFEMLAGNKSSKTLLWMPQAAKFKRWRAKSSLSCKHHLWCPKRECVQGGPFARAQEVQGVFVGQGLAWSEATC